MSFYLVTEKWKDKHVMCSKVQPTNRPKNLNTKNIVKKEKKCLLNKYFSVVLVV